MISAPAETARHKTPIVERKGLIISNIGSMKYAASRITDAIIKAVIIRKEGTSTRYSFTK